MPASMPARLLLAAAAALAALEALPLPAGDDPAPPSPLGRIASAVRRELEENARRPEPPPPLPGGEREPSSPDPVGPPARRLRGEALADRLFRTAFGAARAELGRGTPPGDCARALLAALGMCLDPSGLLERHPLSRLLAGSAGGAAEAQAARPLVKEARLRGRLDSLQHFVVAAGLTALAGRDAAWLASLEKEVEDAMKKDRGAGSGFSFADLAADRAGIELATRLLERAESREALERELEALSKGFRGADHVPDLGPYERDPDESLGWKAFQARYGSLTDARFLSRVETLRADVLRSPAFR